MRPVSEAERISYELTSKEDPTKWRSLADILPKRDYIDMVDVPADGEVEDPDLPSTPDSTTALIPRRRVHGKQREELQEMISPEKRRLRQIMEREEYPEDINDYEPSPMQETSSPRWSNIEHDAPEERALPEPKRHRTVEGEIVISDIEDSFMAWHAQMVKEDGLEVAAIEQARNHSEDLLRIEVDMDLDSHRVRKQFIRNPTAYTWSRR